MLIGIPLNWSSWLGYAVILYFVTITIQQFQARHTYFYFNKLGDKVVTPISIIRFDGLLSSHGIAPQRKPMTVYLFAKLFLHIVPRKEMEKKHSWTAIAYLVQGHVPVLNRPLALSHSESLRRIFCIPNVSPMLVRAVVVLNLFPRAEEF